METAQLKFCPICTKDLPVSEFGICRARKDGRNLYCKRCVRGKVYAWRAALKEYKAAQKQRVARRAEIVEMVHYDPLTDAQWPSGCVFKLSPVDRVRVAIQKGCRTQKEIRRETKLRKDAIGEALANLLLWTGEIKTKVVDETRLYYPSENVTDRAA